MIKQYIYKIVILLFIALIATVFIQRSCYTRKLQQLAEVKEKDRKAINELKESPELATIVISKKPKGIAVITKDTPKDTSIKMKEYDIPAESDYKIRIDTTGQVNVIYRKWGGCFFPKISMDVLPSGVTFGLSARLLYIRRWGLEAGAGIYPVIGVKVGIDYRLPRFSNMTVQGGIFWNGKSLTGYLGAGIFLW